MGLSYTGSSCLETASVAGYSRVPEPPARTMPFMPVLSLQRSLFQTLHVGIDHHGDEVLQAGLGRPPQYRLCLARVAEHSIDIGPSKQGLVQFNVPLVIQSGMGERNTAEIAHRGAAAGGDDVIIGLVLLQH